MKKYVLLVLTAFFALNLSVAQSSCSEYYPLVDGATFQYTSYDKKGKEEGQINYLVTNVSSSGDQVSATMAMEIADQKGQYLFF